uniref:Ovule protein n=1 Tax=Romanomermis culicivorax TaxID=13658 RepID=A0A915KPG0_ROMCU
MRKIHKMSTLFEHMSTENELPAYFILTVILKPLSIVWFPQFTCLLKWSTTWFPKLSTSYESPNLAELKLLPLILSKSLDYSRETDF